MPYSYKEIDLMVGSEFRKIRQHTLYNQNLPNNSLIVVRWRKKLTLSVYMNEI